jgi:hypothetical protein
VSELHIEYLGERLFALSAKLRESGFLDDDENHAAYEQVVDAFEKLETRAKAKGA